MQKIKTLLFIAAACFALSLLPRYVHAEDRVISDLSTLKTFRDKVNSGTDYAGSVITLSSDIDLSSEEWIPIGTENAPFRGTFEGSGKTISNIHIAENSLISHAGLFGVNSGTINNLIASTSSAGIKGHTTSTEQVYAGVIAAVSTSSVTGCSVSGTVTSTNSRYASYVASGGICGKNTGVITSCTNSSVISSESTTDYSYLYGDAYSGGICGINSGTIITPVSTGAVTAISAFASAAAGGISGDNRGIISGGTSSGKITAHIKYPIYMGYAYSGGVCGSNTGSISGDISSSDVDAFLEAGSDIKCFDYTCSGGICGYNNGSVAECSSSGSSHSWIVYDSDALSYAGGGIGYNNGTIVSSFSTGGVSGREDYASYSPIYAGGFVGYNENGTISRCHAGSGNVQTMIETGKTKYTGGFVGRNAGGKISLSYSASPLVCSADVSIYGGGFVGDNEGAIDNCYYIGSNVNAGKCGGFAGANSGTIENAYTKTTDYASAAIRGGFTAENAGALKNCFYCTLNAENTGYGEAKTSAELKDKATYSLWPFDTFWQLTSENYPTLNDNAEAFKYSGGSGTQSDPYLIATADDLNKIRYMPQAHFMLVTDISVSDVWMPIGTNETDAFKGILDGNGFTIKNIKTPQSGLRYAGLIGYGDGCTLINITLDSAAEITAQIPSETPQEVSLKKGAFCAAYGGGIAGYAVDSYIENCAFYGKVKAMAQTVYAGGITGLFTGTEKGCTSKGTVNIVTAGNFTNCFLGGISGYEDGRISGCGSSAYLEVSANADDKLPVESIGGICGYITGTVSDSCFNGNVTISTGYTTSGYAAGIAGTCDGNITNSYSDSSISIESTE